MASKMLPGPGPDEPDETGHANARGKARGERSPGGGQRRRAKRPPPSVDDCLAALAHIAGLVAMRLLAPAQANSMRAIYHEILAYHQGKAQRAEALSNAKVMEILHRDPALLNALEPLMTDDQIDMVMKAEDDDADEEETHE
jgi:hypothetical protein